MTLHGILYVQESRFLSGGADNLDLLHEEGAEQRRGRWGKYVSAFQLHKIGDSGTQGLRHCTKRIIEKVGLEVWFAGRKRLTMYVIWSMDC